MSRFELLQHLTGLSKQLDDASDRVNAAIDDFEEQLEQTGAGVSAYVDGPEGWSIGYSKLDGKWRLVAGRAETGTIKLTAAPRLVRIAALGMQDQIIQALIDRTVECLNSIEAARK